MAKSKARSVADVSSGTILATVEIEATPERVFTALSSKEIAAWWGAEGVYRTTSWTGDVRVGGKWRSDGVGADGKPFAVEGEYLEVDAPRRLVHTWKPDWHTGKATTVTYRLEPIEGGTRLTLRHDGFESAEVCRSHGDGWVRVLGWLQQFASPKAVPRSFFVVRLLAPRPTFIADITDDERRIMGEHAAYWAKLLADGVAHVFGPVLDPNGPWGLGVLEVADASVLPSIEANDPVIKGIAGFRYEVLPMLQAVTRG